MAPSVELPSGRMLSGNEFLSFRYKILSIFEADGTMICDAKAILDYASESIDKMVRVQISD